MKQRLKWPVRAVDRKSLLTYHRVAYLDVVEPLSSYLPLPALAVKQTGLTALVVDWFVSGCFRPNGVC